MGFCDILNEIGKQIFLLLALIAGTLTVLLIIAISAGLLHGARMAIVKKLKIGQGLWDENHERRRR